MNIVSFESFHQAVHHHHNHGLHSAEAEKDACHRAIYHGDVFAACDHKGHIAESEIECDLCEVLTSRSSGYVLDTQEACTYFGPTSFVTELGSQIVQEPNFHLAFLRGPPQS